MTLNHPTKLFPLGDILKQHYKSQIESAITSCDNLILEEKDLGELVKLNSHLTTLKTMLESL